MPYSQWAEEPFKVLEGHKSQEMERILEKFLETKGVTVERDSTEYKLLLREISRAYLSA